MARDGFDPKYCGMCPLSEGQQHKPQGKFSARYFVFWSNLTQL